MRTEIFTYVVISKRMMVRGILTAHFLKMSGPVKGNRYQVLRPPNPFVLLGI